MRVLICGSRYYNDYKGMYLELSKIFDIDDTITLIHGDAKGADRLSEEVLKNYFKGGLIVEKYPADWNKYGKAAGPIRNKQMLVEGKPDLVIAFIGPNSRGTANMVKLTKEANIPVKEINI